MLPVRFVVRSVLVPFSVLSLIAVSAISCSKEPAAPAPATEPTDQALETATSGYLFSRHALIVDDARFQGHPDDDDHDAFMEEVFLPRLFELGEVDERGIWGYDQSSERTSHVPYRFRTGALLRYRTVVWHTHLSTGTPRTGLWENERILGHLSEYVASGGRLLIVGSTVAGTITGTAPFGNLVYPKRPPDNLEGLPPISGYEFTSFLWRSLRFRGAIVSVPFQETEEQKQASTMIGAIPQVAGLPTISLDPTKQDPYEIIDCDNGGGCRFMAGLGRWEGLLPVEPLAAEAEILYRVQTWNQFLDPDVGAIPVQSVVDGAAIVHRFETAAQGSPVGRPGRVVFMGFQPWYFEASGVNALGDELINWLSEEPGVAQ